MIQVAPQHDPRLTTSGELRVWGLDIVDLHAAYWRARGAQCLRLGQRQTLQRGAELFLLLGPEQLVTFDLPPLADRLTWHDAAVIRLRLLDQHVHAYQEQVAVDDGGWVRRIERRYDATVIDQRIGLTTSRRAARLWMAATSARNAWQQLRRTFGTDRIDPLKRPGVVASTRLPGDPERILASIIARWSRPDSVIDGIEQTTAGVWRRRGAQAPAHNVRIGPVWMGDQPRANSGQMLFGPDYLPDGSDASSDSPLRLRNIDEVELPEGRSAEATGNAHAQRPYLTFKRVMDTVLALIGLLVCAPVFLIIAIAIAVTDGRPVFFGHRRQGRRGRPFVCWKFRTMHRDAERRAAELKDGNVCDGPQVYIADDPRVTRLGALLRSTQLDELPQLFNVLRGEMSLVGPRPSPEAENQYCPAWREARLRVRPGITGLWQIKRTREPGEDFQEWIRYDIEYVRRMSFGLDTWILLRTVLLVIMRRTNGANDQAR